MILPASQIVGLIEIETASNADSGSLVALGLEELSLGELLAWLTEPIARPLVDADSAELAATVGPTNRLTGRIAAGPVSHLNADLRQLETDLVEAALQFRLRLAEITTAE
jgi:hypothetical protein